MDVPEDTPSHDILAIDDALSRLAAEDAVKAELVKLRYFGGLSVEDAGRVLGICWRHGRSLLGLCPGVALQRVQRRGPPVLGSENKLTRQRRNRS